MDQLALGRLGEEYEGAALGDERRTRRLQKVVRALEADPSAPLPRAMGTEGALEGCYRFLNNDRVAADAILAPHVRQTRRRASAYEEVWVAHDTVAFRARDDERIEGMGPLTSKAGARGFFGHVSLALSPTEVRDPLGVVGMRTLVRSEKRSYSKKVKTLNDPTNEYRRWRESVDAVEKSFEGTVPVIHVMDREADVYELFAHFVERGHRFVIRLSDNRATPERVPGTRRHVRLSDVLEGLDTVAERHVPLSHRKAQGGAKRRKIHPARKERTAHLSIRTATVEIARPAPLPKDLPASLTLKIVHVVERNPPDGEPPVEWKLLTTEPVDTEAEALRVVDIYRSRWRIEELFKALKTGCAFEKRMFRSFAAIKRLLAVFLPVAWRLLRLRTLAATIPDRPGTDALSPTQIAVLRTVNKRGPIPDEPTVLDIFVAIAGLGGHLKRNGPPGWQVLGRGLDSLLNYEVGWRAARGT